MKLAYINPQAVPDTLPSTMQILQVVDAMGSLGIDVQLVTPTAPAGVTPESLLGRPLSARVSLHPLRDIRKTWFFPFSSNRPFYFQARRWIKKHRPDFVLVRNLKLAEEILAMAPRPKVLFETHELFAQTYREDHPNPTPTQQKKIAALAAREKHVYASVDGLITITSALLADIRATYGVKTPAVVAPDGVDLPLAQEAFSRHAAKELPPNDPPVLLYIGSLHPWKGVDTLIQAMPHTGPCELRIAGGNPQQIERLRMMATQNGSIGKIRFLGKVPPLSRFEVIAGADICLLPLTNTSIASRYTSPLKLFEYMAMGKPIVVADHESIREVLTDRIHAILIKQVEDPVCFAAGINQLLENPSLARQLSHALLDMRQQYDWQSRCRLIIDTFSVRPE